MLAQRTEHGEIAEASDSKIKEMEAQNLARIDVLRREVEEAKLHSKIADEFIEKEDSAIGEKRALAECQAKFTALQSQLEQAYTSMESHEQRFQCISSENIDLISQVADLQSRLDHASEVELERKQKFALPMQLMMQDLKIA